MEDDCIENWIPTVNAELRDFMVKAYNGWFCKWRDRAATMSDYEWDKLIEEGDAMLSASHGGTLEHRITALFLREMEARRRAARQAAGSA